MYPKIVVPLDSSDLAERVFPLVRLLARSYHAPVELLSVIQEVPGYLGPEMGREEALAYWKEHAQNYLNTASQQLDVDLGSSTKVAVGDTAEKILEEAAQDPGALIAISTHGWAGSSRWNLGSVTLKVLQAASNPVLVVRGRKDAEAPEETKLENIIIPLDGSSLSEQSLPHAVALAKAHPVTISLVRVTPTAWDYYTYMDHTVLHSGDVSRNANDKAQEYLDHIAADVKKQVDSPVEVRIEHGEPASAILDISEKTPNSMVTMVTRGEGGSGGIRWNLGSVAQRVAGNSTCPVLVIRAPVDL